MRDLGELRLVGQVEKPVQTVVELEPHLVGVQRQHREQLELALAGPIAAQGETISWYTSATAPKCRVMWAYVRLGTSLHVDVDAAVGSANALRG
jgi:hypothetical protein